MYRPILNGKQSTLQDFLFVGIATAADSTTDSIAIESKRNSKDFDEEDFWKFSAATNPCYSKLIAVNMAMVTDDGELRLKQIRGDEQEILSEFVTFVTDTAKHLILATYSPSFLIPYLRTKCLKHDIFYPWNDAMLKPWEVGLERNAKLKIFDIASYHKGCSYFNTPFVEFIESVGVFDLLKSKGEDIDFVQFNTPINVDSDDDVIVSTLNRVKYLVLAVNSYFRQDIIGYGSDDPDSSQQPNKETLPPTDIDLSLDSDIAIDYRGLEIKKVSKVRGKYEYTVQLSDNSDITFPCKVKPKVGEMISKYLNLQ